MVYIIHVAIAAIVLAIAGLENGDIVAPEHPRPRMDAAVVRPNRVSYAVIVEANVALESTAPIPHREIGVRSSGHVITVVGCARAREEADVIPVACTAAASPLGGLRVPSGRGVVIVVIKQPTLAIDPTWEVRFEYEVRIYIACAAGVGEHECDRIRPVGKGSFAIPLVRAYVTTLYRQVSDDVVSP